MERAVIDDSRDAFDHMLSDFVAGTGAFEIVERDDGFIGADSPAKYIAPYRDWPAHQQTALRYATGRVLDIGCGAGRHALYLQDKGLDVVGIDVSPLAIEVCKRRGLAQAVVMPVTGISRRLGTFDTLLMLGNNFGLCGSAGSCNGSTPRRARGDASSRRAPTPTRRPIPCTWTTMSATGVTTACRASSGCACVTATKPRPGLTTS